MLLDLELFTEFGDYRVVEIHTIVSDDSLWDTVSTDEILFDEPGYNILGNGSERSRLNPLCEIVMATKMKRCPLEVVGLISPIISIPHIAKGQGAIKTFRGTGSTCTLSA